ncbi:hypothetical protein AO464_02975 [Oenococcus oeni]|uniref:hypothetical protein n=2 Tax=Oenococcus oeni TaxID=1247 RepID=UPI000BDF8710|nr:hypothetical protein [Oenococcus oeni]PDH85415.1 hypothetical protein AO464_02975 [Oenococcus oeni]PDH86221.1 hypothetical protein AO463_04280 [Oenococcus oeni]PDH88364.1 hypothetical protein AO465_04845 [Oenococcus oeni]PDH95193.1 hypothetical protein AO468_01610 [Oenococcus oeni]RJF36438.1 hypothetical protein D5F74_06395 [Oenococcus oeni]
MKIAKYVSLIVASITLMFAAILLIQFNDSEKWSIDAHQSGLFSQTININSNDQPATQKKILTALAETADHYSLGVIRVDDQVGATGAYRIGVYDPEGVIKFVNRKNQLKSSGITSLSSKRLWSTKSMDTRHLSLFNLMNSSSVVVTSLDSLLNHTETINGQYQMATIKKTNFQNMLDFFSKRSGIKEKQLLAQHSFKQHTISIAFNLSLVLFALLSVVSIVFGIFSIYDKNQLVGVQKLLGYSSFRIVWSHAVNNWLVVFAAFSLEILMLRIAFSQLDNSIYPILFLFQLPLLIVLSLDTLIQFLLVHRQKATNFIKQNLRSRLLICVVCGLFIFTSGLCVYMLRVIDYQSIQIFLNAKKMQHWQQRNDNYVLSEISAGNDSASFTYQSNKIDHDLQNFYTQIADKKGVFLAASSHFDQSKAQRQLYQFWGLPNLPSFSLLQLSPSALKKYHISNNQGQSIKISNQDKTKYYLIPDKFRNNLKYQRFFKKFALINSTVNPSNKAQVKQFLDSHPVQIVYYKNTRSFASWDSSDSRSLKLPIIEVITAAGLDTDNTSNMRVVGLDNLLKLDRKVVASAAFKRAIANSDLSDNQLVFRSIKDSLLSDRSNYFQLLAAWGSFLFILLLAILQSIVSLNLIWQSSHEKQLFVQRLLGYSSCHKYRFIYLLISISDLIAFIFGIAFRSSYISFGFVILFALEMLVIYHSVRKVEFKKISEELKGLS